MRAVGVHHIDLRVATAAGYKGNLAAVSAEGWVPFYRRVGGEAGLMRAVGVHYINLIIVVAAGGKNNLFRVGRKRADVAAVRHVVAIAVRWHAPRRVGITPPII